MSLCVFNSSVRFRSGAVKKSLPSWQKNVKKMIGNDIVDLALAKKESNWQRAGFLDKIFTTKEQLLIEDSDKPEIMVWNLWSRKEAAYKIYNRETGIRAFIPSQLECIYVTESLGTVVCNGNSYFTKTEISNDAIHTVAVTEKKHFKQIMLVNSNAKIHKINGLPFLKDDLTDTLKPISISHHGRFMTGVAIE